MFPITPSMYVRACIAHVSYSNIQKNNSSEAQRSAYARGLVCPSLLNEGTHERRRCGIRRRINRTVLMLMHHAGLMWRELRPLGRRHDRQKEKPLYVVFFLRSSVLTLPDSQIPFWQPVAPYRDLGQTPGGFGSARAAYRGERQEEIQAPLSTGIRFDALLALTFYLRSPPSYPDHSFVPTIPSPGL